MSKSNAWTADRAWPAGLGLAAGRPAEEAGFLPAGMLGDRNAIRINWHATAPQPGAADDAIATTVGGHLVMVTPSSA